MDKINEALVILVELLKSTKDFVGDQAPKIAQEIINYTFYNNLIWSVLFSLLFITFTIISFISYKRFNSEKAETDINYKEYYQITFIFSPIFSILFLILLVINLNDLLQCKVAPRMVILDYITKHIQK